MSNNVFKHNRHPFQLTVKVLVDVAMMEEVMESLLKIFTLFEKTASVL